MSKAYRVLTHQDLEQAGSGRQQFGLEVLLGLSRTEKSLPSKYFYDDRGSELFEQITELDDYYPTSCEQEIFETRKGELAELLVGEPFNLIDLGSGDGRKTRLLLEEFTRHGLDFVYIPVDISEAAVSQQTSQLAKSFPDLPVEGIVAEYFDGLLWHSSRKERRNVVLFLGSNVGNFHRSEARAFMRSIWTFLQPKDLLLTGFDLKKDIEVMAAAYNDRKGITREFNLNLLRRINRELDANFDLSKFYHYAPYDLFSGAMESYLVSTERQSVEIRAIHQVIDFEPFEPIHTEYSYKFLDSDIEQLAADTGFEIVTQLYDSKRWFVDSVWSVTKEI